MCSGRCPAGKFCSGATVEPETCPPGSFCALGSAAPLPCPGGTFGAAADLAHALAELRAEEAAAAPAAEDVLWA